jgi:hypothetical protein
VTIADGSSYCTLAVTGSAAVTIPAGITTTITNLIINGATASVTLNQEYTFQDVTVTNGVLTSAAYDNANSGGAWTSTPGPGNGRLIMTVNGTLTVGTSGRIHMDAKGYIGGTSTRTQGGSPTGPGTSSSSANGGGGGGNSANSQSAGAGSYGTVGVDVNSAFSSASVAGATYGASDFDTQLYLGAGGGGNSFNGHTGGYGGGAIKLNVANLSIASGGQISSKGGSPSSVYAGAGAGGTVVIDISGTYTNSGGTISVAGGTSAWGLNGGSGRLKFPQAKLIDASNNLSVVGLSLYDINLTSNVNTLTVGANATVNLTASNNVTVTSLVINGANAELRLNDQWTTATFGKSFGSITVTNGVLTSNAYSNTYSGSTWSTTPAAGNGQLIVDVTGTLTVGASGRIHMDGKGYIGGTRLATQGGSPTGPGTTSTSANGGGGGGTANNSVYAGGGSYGTAGMDYSSIGHPVAGTTYGASDFDTQLYLGSGGGANSFNASVGGYGGGAIKLNVANLSIASGGQISSRGGSPGQFGGGGSGGTVVIDISGTYTNSGGTISVAGGTSTWISGGSGRLKFPVAKLADASNNVSVVGFSLIDINLTSNVNTLTVGANTTVNLTAANNVTVTSLVINGANAELRLNDQWTTATFGKSFGSITVTNGVLTSNAYSNTYSGSTWSTTPAAGNGQLIVDVTGTLTVGASGRIHMDSKGYIGGTWNRTQGGSPTGPGTTSTSANGGGGGGTATNGWSAGGGSYGTAGTAGNSSAGSTYGSSDFTTQLYLGSGGGANSFNANPGGYGGGAIKLSIGSGSIASGGQITAKGGSASTYGGSGSGGTIVISSTGSFTNNGTLSVTGGTGGRAGGNGRSQP